MTSKTFRRRTGVIACLSAFTLASALVVGTAAYAVGQSEATASSSASAASPAAASASGAVSLRPHSRAPLDPYAYYSLDPYSQGSTASGTATTDAVAASAEQTAGVVTIVSDLAYQGAQSAGTGIVLTSDGLILTNNHVIEGSTGIEVTDELTGAVYSATVVGTDATHDIAVLQLDGASGLETAVLASAGDGDAAAVAVGDTVTAVGNAQGTGDLVAATGTVTALEQSITMQSETGAEGESLTGLIQVDADIVSGDSGGPLVNTAGEVVGIDTAASSGTADITGFAIPIDDALDIVAQIDAGADTEFIEIGYPGFLGVGIGASSAAGGAVVAGVYEGTPAEAAGLAAGDVITAVDGVPVSSAAELTANLGTREPGETVTLEWTTAAGAAASAAVTLIAGPAA
ncbi:trypsin-like peptidase domain-containing protein [Herbiconiux sp.]|uniref:S1C family serine protease n=1 Tax=Herbiconiux sp. TaxID=1871186 RepID=UPI0025C26C4B|nr:trypsin-like peptidase domain-containing protein [Herbiconiux sp.]